MVDSVADLLRAFQGLLDLVSGPFGLGGDVENALEARVGDEPVLGHSSENVGDGVYECDGGEVHGDSEDEEGEHFFTVMHGF